MVYDQHFCLQIQELHRINLGLQPQLYGLGEDLHVDFYKSEDKRLTQQHQLETEETLQQVMRQSEHPPQQLSCEQETANRGTREVEEEIHGLQQQVSLLINL